MKTCASCRHWSEEHAAADKNGMRAMCMLSGTYTPARATCLQWSMSDKYRVLIAAHAAHAAHVELARQHEPMPSWWQDNWPTLGICLVIWATASAICLAMLEIWRL